MAVREEDEGNFSEAISYYVKSVTESLEAGSLVRAALSCSCAASCLAKIGDESSSHQMYCKAAAIYQEQAVSILGESIRESLWCLRRARYFFLAGMDEPRARQLSELITSLEKRIDPFSIQEREDVPLAKETRKKVPIGSRTSSKNHDAMRMLDELLATRISASTIRRVKGERRDEESIRVVSSHDSGFVNQLG
jgi:hypothetical protein